MSDMPDSTHVLIPFPDLEALKTEVEKLRTELSMLYLERDDLLYQECKNIEMAYMLSVGGLEYKVFELDCQIRRQKRKVELIQAKKNRQEKIIVSQIDRALDAEFAQYQAMLNEQVEKMNDALARSHGTPLTESESQELKKLYRAIVKALHPDLHPDLSDAQAQLFFNAVSAYEQGDLYSLRVIEVMVAAPAIPAGKTGGSAALAKEKERLLKLLQAVKGGISEIKSQFPYTMKAFVQSPEEIDARKAELQGQIEKLTEALTAYNDKIAEMLR